MSELFSRLLQTSTIAAGLCLLTSSIAQAQPISSDGTLPNPTEVNSTAAGFEINSGTTRGSNLFHSFRDFSVPTGLEASFNNADTIANILSRVTGGNISNIDGLIRANGSANLFLINPAGIIFGEGARLDIGGSFFGSTANSILFDDGEFSATDLDNPPLLTINGPIGLGFRDNPGEVQVQGSSLEVENSQTLALVGNKLSFSGGNIQVPFFPINVDGELSLPGGNLFAPEGRIELGSVSGEGDVSLRSTTLGWELGYEDVQNFGDIELREGAVINASGTGGGSIQVRGSQVSLLDGSRIVSFTLGSQSGGDFTLNANNLLLEDGAGITTSTFNSGKGGNLTINTLDSVELSGILSFLFASSVGTGDAGDLRIETNKLTLSDGAEISTNAFSQGQGGELTIIATEFVELLRTPAEAQFPTGLFAETSSTGDAGNLTIDTSKLTLSDGAEISTNTFSQGQGGDLTIKASESVELIGVDGQFATGLFAESGSFGSGDAGNLTIDTGKFIARNGGYASTSSFGEGQAGNLNVNAIESIELIGTGIIGENRPENVVSSALFSFTRGSQDGGDLTINTRQLFLRDGGQINTGTSGTGKAGNLTVNASESVEIIGVSSNNFFSSRLDSRTTGDGDAGELRVNTERLILQDGGQISVSTFGNGNSGKLIVNASESVEIIGTEPIGPNDLVSGIYAQTSDAESEGNGGNIEINTPTLSITDGGVIFANTSNQGNAGNIDLSVEDNLILSGTDTGLFSRTTEEAVGDGGSISVDTRNLTITDGATVAVNSQGQGNGGIVSITTSDLTLDGKASISASTTAGEGGDIFLTIDDNLILRNNSTIIAQAFGTANGGNIDIDADFIIAFPNQNNDILASASEGRGGNIKITTQGIFGIEKRPQNPLTNDIDASSEFGLDGTIIINILDVNPLQTDSELPENVVEPEQTVAQACESDRLAGKSSGLAVKGKGGMPPQPSEPLNSDAILVDGQLTNLDPEVQSLNIKPIKTSQGDIYPARGVIVKEDGSFILTAYPTDGIDTRSPNIRANCN